MPFKRADSRDDVVSLRIFVSLEVAVMAVGSAPSSVRYVVLLEEMSVRRVEKDVPVERREEERTEPLQVVMSSSEYTLRRPNSVEAVDSGVLGEEPATETRTMRSKMTPAKAPMMIFIFLSKKPVFCAGFLTPAEIWFRYSKSFMLRLV